jgi:protoporphyrinogen oxidase
MPVKDLIAQWVVPFRHALNRSRRFLPYRDSVTVGLLLNALKIKNETAIPTMNNLVPDNWIYIQERDVKVARVQIFNNWSPYLIADINKVWIGLEYCCNEGDELWAKQDSDVIQFAIDELNQIAIIDKHEVIDSTIIRTPKTYPAYFGTYADFHTIRDYTDRFDNLFLIGRNGMHKYYNQDHAMLTAMAAVNNILSGEKTKENIWDIHSDEKYIETENDSLAFQYEN